MSTESISRVSACNKCGAEYPSAPAGTVHKCGRCSGGYCSPKDKPAPATDEIAAKLEQAIDACESGNSARGKKHLAAFVIRNRAAILSRIRGEGE